MEYTKENIYEKIVTIHKQSGQGLSGIILDSSSEISDIVEELVEEGWVKENILSTSSLGSPRSMYFYTPTKGYNVHEKDGNLNFIRLYLDCLDENGSPVNPSKSQVISDPEFMAEYAIWLKENQEELEELKNLDPYEYVEEGIELEENHIKLLNNYKDITNDHTVADVLLNVVKKIDAIGEIEPLFEKIISSDIQIGKKEAARKSQEELDRLLKERELFRYIKKFLNQQDPNEQLGSIITTPA